MRDEEYLNPLTPNDPYSGRTAPLTSKRCIFHIYSKNIGTEYFKHGIHSPFFFSSKCSLFHNCNIFGSCIVHILYTEFAKIKKSNSGAKSLNNNAIKYVIRLCRVGKYQARLQRTGWTIMMREHLNALLGRKPVPVPLCEPQLPRGLEKILVKSMVETSYGNRIIGIEYVAS